MKHRILLTLLLIGCSRQFQGDKHGTGGNPEPIHLLQGRPQAAAMVEKADPAEFSPAVTALLGSDQTWLQEKINREELARDIRETPHQWVEEHSEHPRLICEVDRCACTAPQPRAPIYFAVNRCAGRIRTVHDASALLLHESTHHLRGASEAIADRIAGGLALAWTESGPAEGPRWQLLAYAPGLKQEQGPQTPPRLDIPVFDGTDLVLVRSIDEIFFFNPISRQWKVTHPLPPLGWGGWARTHQVITVQGRVFLRPQWKGREGASPFGLGFLYNPTREQWEALPRPEGTVSKKLGSAVLERELVVWESPPGSAPSSLPAFLDPVTGRWDSFPHDDVLSACEQPLMLGTPDKLWVWGGTDSRTSQPCYQGKIWDRKTREWKPIARSGGPLWRRNAQLFWTGEEILLWGGLNEQLAPENSGFRYHLGEDRWRPLPPRALPTLDVIPGVWNGKRLIVLADQVHEYDPQTDRWTSFERALVPPLLAPPVWTGLEMVVLTRSGLFGRNAFFGFYPGN